MSKENRTDLRLGNDSVGIITYENNTLNTDFMTYFHPHQDELTSMEVTKKIVDKYGGRLISLKQGNSPIRNINFTLDDKSYSLDPNRMFAKIGIEKNLGTKARDVIIAVQHFASEVARIIFSSVANNLIIAVHNNYNQGGYSIESYKPGSSLADDAIDLYVNPENGTGDFFYVTEKDLFEIIKINKYNVVLQNNKTVEEDGSFSVYSERKGLRYVNIEAKRGNYNQQLDMLEFLTANIR